ncbi:hypothetical protein F5X97DRAFT_201259 [Nemania serpens]|nr:hypothetical protein F5X97DRAFT_201259 [Nemania serpens]
MLCLYQWRLALLLAGSTWWWLVRWLLHDRVETRQCHRIEDLVSVNNRQVDQNWGDRRSRFASARLSLPPHFQSLSMTYFRRKWN